MLHDNFFETDGGTSVIMTENMIANTVDADEVIMLMDDVDEMHRRQPYAAVEYAHLTNKMDEALDEHLANEYNPLH